MERLRLKDFRALLEFLRQAYAVSDPDALRHRVMTALPALIPSDITVCSQIDRERRQFKWAHDVDHFAFHGITGVFERNAHQHPLTMHYRRTGDGRAFKLSDFLTRTELRRLRLYDELYRPMRCECEMAFWLPGAPGQDIAFAVHRARQDFSERERRLLNLARPHLVQIHAAAQAMTLMHQQLGLLTQEREQQSQGVLFLSREARVLHASASARQYLAEYFEGQPRRADALPDTLERWIRLQEGFLEARDEIPAPREPLVVERDGKRLVVRLVSNPAQRLLLLEEQRTRLEPSAFEPLGLSPRESEVLAWVVEGKTNPEIATILGISARTVQTHLERIYRKLDVGTRAAAVASVLQAGVGQVGLLPARASDVRLQSPRSRAAS